MANFAWTDILTGEKKIACGEQVSAADVGGKDELERLKAEGSVRSMEFPVPAGVTDSPVNYRLAEMRKQLAEMGTSLEELEGNYATAANAGAENVSPPVDEVK